MKSKNGNMGERVLKYECVRVESKKFALERQILLFREIDLRNLSFSCFTTKLKSMRSKKYLRGRIVSDAALQKS